jgi:hypothetical protein
MTGNDPATGTFLEFILGPSSWAFFTATPLPFSGMIEVFDFTGHMGRKVVEGDNWQLQHKRQHANPLN